MNNSLQESIIFQLHNCLNLLRRGPGQRRGGPHGHGPHGHGSHRGQGRLLSLLKDKGPTGQRELAEWLQIQPPSLSELLRKLEGQGLVERVQNPGDKRSVNVSITLAGRELVEEVEQSRQAMTEKLLSGLTIEEQGQLSGLLDKLLASLEAHQEELCEHRRGCHGHEQEHGGCREDGSHGERHGHGRCCPGGRPGRGDEWSMSGCGHDHGSRHHYDAHERRRHGCGQGAEF